MQLPRAIRCRSVGVSSTSPHRIGIKMKEEGATGAAAKAVKTGRNGGNGGNGGNSCNSGDSSCTCDVQYSHYYKYKTVYVLYLLISTRVRSMAHNLLVLVVIYGLSMVQGMERWEHQTCLRHPGVVFRTESFRNRPILHQFYLIRLRRQHAKDGLTVMKRLIGTQQTSCLGDTNAIRSMAEFFLAPWQRVISKILARRWSSR